MPHLVNHAARLGRIDQLDGVVRPPNPMVLLTSVTLTRLPSFAFFAARLAIIT
jgi:hypothetical protein